ncbi:MAG: type I-C CRISPR-associated endonuclease Cas1 [Proteobacteria bacterium]|nr:type I-C CRISPR-associated endonuclease Cas1 [Pseudomonadota bacterium]
MKHLLNTLYVTTQGAYLSREGETVRVSVEKEVKLSLPVHTIGSIVCFGQVMMSPPLMGLCAERGITCVFLTEYGKFLARVEGPTRGNVLLRREQYRKADDESFSASIARAVVVAKIANARQVLMRTARESSCEEDVKALDSVTTRLARLMDETKTTLPLDAVRGKEGDAARMYFEVFDRLILTQKEEFFFRGRNRRPPLDNMNALLSFLYTLVVHDCRSALEGVGLDPSVGYLHVDRPGRPSLALDLMEELRPVVADRLALTLVNRQQVKGKGFRKTESGAVAMDDETRKVVLVAYQERKREEIVHPFIDEKIAYGLLPHVQAMLFARYLRGDIDGYPPYFWR